MKKQTLLGWVTRAFSVILGLAVLAFSLANSFGLMALLLPGDVARQAGAVVLFDGGMIVWLLVFVYGSHGFPQRGVAIIAAVLCLLGVLAANFLYLAVSQRMATLDADTLASYASWSLTVIEVVLAMHIVAGVAHNLTAPEVMDAIRAQGQVDATVDLANQRAEARMDEVAEEAAERIAAGNHANTMRRLGALTATPLDDLARPALAPARTTRVVDADADVDAAIAARRERMAAGPVMARTAPAMPTVAEDAPVPEDAPGK